MKDQKNGPSSSILPKLCTFFTFLIITTTFGTLSYCQWKEIIKLNDRVTALELDRTISVHRRNQDNPGQNKISETNVKTVTDVYEQLLHYLSKNQKSLLSRFCANTTNVCIQGPPGPKGDKGDRGPPGADGKVISRDLRDVQEHDRSLNPLMYRAVADSCCNHLAKPILNGPTQILLTANKGGDIILPCKPTGLPPAEVQWVPAVDPKQLGRYIQTVDGLLVKATDFVDTTTFTCRATNVFGTVDKTIRLIVLDPITVSVTPSISQASANQSIDYTCTFTGVPPPIVKWYHLTYNNQKQEITSGITTANQQSFLHIDNLNALSAGGYICEVSNSFDNKSSTASLGVISKPFIVNGPLTQTVNVGNTVTLRCDVVSDPPSSVAWTFPKTGTIPPKTASINPDGSVTLFHVDAFSEGQYTCTATNTMGSTTSAGTLNVNVPFTVTTNPHLRPLTTGESFVQLTCAATGGNTPTLTWSKKFSPSLSANPQKYLLVGDGVIITSVDLATDTGAYVCKGTDGNQKSSDKAILYKDMGQLNCTTTLSECGIGIGGACGGTCPGTCQSGTIYGYDRYTLTSAVCLAARHSGALDNNNKAVWTVEHSIDTFEAKMSNGIMSQYSGPVAQEAVFYHPMQSTQPVPFG